jgi:hypothetical protein
MTVIEKDKFSSGSKHNGYVMYMLTVIIASIVFEVLSIGV